MAQAPILYISRTIEFAAAHRLYREDWTEKQNRDVFGLCANRYGHGHNYLLEAIFCGTPDPETGMVIHFQTLKKVLQETVEIPLDHRHLNHDVDFLKGILPTSENLIQVLWDRLARLDLGRAKLHKLVLSTSARNRVEYLGPDHG